jgi:hypothetical protein
MQTANLRHRWMSALWAAFLSAAVLEMVVFALVDPEDLRWLDGDALGLSPRAVYTLAFFLFWAIVSVGAGLAILLCTRPGEDGDAAPADLRLH